MSIDYTKHAYVKVGNYSNVVNEIEHPKMRNNGESYIPSPLDSLIDKLSLRHPEWQLVGYDSWWHEGKGFKANRFKVYEGNDHIGTITLDTWRDPKFEIANARIANDMERRRCKTTKDVDKAVKIVEQYFSSKTMSERIAEGKSLTTNTISNKMWNADRGFETVFKKVAPALVTYVVLNMGSIRHILEGYGAPADALDMLGEKNEIRKAAAEMANSHGARTGTTVLIHGDRYVLLRSNDDTATILAASQLDDDTRTKLGILKVVGDEEIVESIGVRVNATTFYLLP